MHSHTAAQGPTLKPTLKLYDSRVSRGLPLHQKGVISCCNGEEVGAVSPKVVDIELVSPLLQKSQPDLKVSCHRESPAVHRSTPQRERYWFPPPGALVLGTVIISP